MYIEYSSNEFSASPAADGRGRQVAAAASPHSLTISSFSLAANSIIQGNETKSQTIRQKQPLEWGERVEKPRRQKRLKQLRRS